MARTLERRSGELTLSQYRVLEAVAAGDQRASRVAARLAIGKPTISASVEYLCQRKLLTRSRVADDQRAVELQLTVAGAAVLRSAQASMLERIEAVCAHTPDPELTMRVLTWLAPAFDELSGDDPTSTQSPAVVRGR
jgi:DNA-binding MarR family transcriptional regulator